MAAVPLGLRDVGYSCETIDDAANVPHDQALFLSENRLASCQSPLRAFLRLGCLRRETLKCIVHMGCGKYKYGCNHEKVVKNKNLFKSPTGTAPLALPSTGTRNQKSPQ